MPPTREQVIEWAQQSGFGVQVLNSIDGDEALTECCGMRVTDELERLAALAYSAGRLKGLEEAKEVAPDIARAAQEKWSHEETWKQPYAGNRLVHVGWDIAAAIDQLKEQK